MDKDTRTVIERATQRVRKLLEEDFAAQLEGDFDVQRDGAVAAKAGKHLSARQAFARERIVAAIEHKRAAGMSAADAARDYLRDAAFTTLNRFVALKMLEARELVQECITKGEQSAGYREFCGMAPGLPLLPDGAGYRLYLECLFDELSVDLKVLFNRRDVASVLWPKRAGFEALLKTLNAPDLAAVWGEDETIGWVYQYYNDEAERKKMREDSSAPRNSRELAVRNQFFTPRYVVEFLTDNTLGRLWYEMTKGQTVLKEQCRYLVRRPTEIFLKPGESAPESTAGSEAKAGEDLSQEELLRQPVHIPHRPLKDPREIRLLDPACGSMHFGLYAFDLFTVIYEEAWEIAHGPDHAAKSAVTFAPFVTFAASFPDKAAFLREILRLIVEHNIHGIDIDPRAAQIAGLSLWLRAQRAWHQAGVKPADRPRITRSNLVCAEPMPGEKELLREFVEQQFPAGERPAFSFLLETVFDRMTLAGEAGSLLRIEEEIRSAIADAKRLWKAGPKHEQATLFPEAGARPGQGKMRLDLSGITDEQFWERAEQRIYDALEAYAGQAENGGGFQRRLFADDAAQGFAFIDLCRKRYDVVVMNPPFGEPTAAVAEKIAPSYPAHGGNLAIMFHDRVFARLTKQGSSGAVVDNTILVKSTYSKFRQRFAVDKQLIRNVVYLGWGTLDGANVEVSLDVVTSDSGCGFNVIDASALERADSLLSAVNQLASAEDSDAIMPLSAAALSKIPNLSISFSKDTRVHAIGEKLSKSYARAKQGLAPVDTPRLIRLRWEVPPNEMKLAWPALNHGGAYSPFYRDHSFVINWRSNGAELKAKVLHNYPYLGDNWGWVVKNDRLYGRPGLAYGKRTDLLSVQVQNSEMLFSNEGFAIFPIREEDIWFLLGFLNSPAVGNLLNTFCGQHKVSGYVDAIPVPSFSSEQRRELAALAQSGYADAREMLVTEETGGGFVSRTFAAEYLSQSFDGFVERQTNLREKQKQLLAKADSIVESLLGSIERRTSKSVELEVSKESYAAAIISYLLGAAFGRWDIRYATGERPAPELPDPFSPLPVCPPGMLQGDDGLPLSPEAGRRLRTEGRYPLDVAWDGILVDDPEHPLDLERRVHAALAVLCGGGGAPSTRADALEHEACALLGVPTLREWFRRPAGFFADHLKRYSKSRRQAPIYWPLSTASGSYSVWLYYHRLGKDTLYRTLELLKEKVIHEEGKLSRLTLESGAASTSMQRRELAAQDELVVGLHAVHEEVARVAPLWNPNLNDGVIINYGPLWRLIGHKPWQKAVKERWDELVLGEYDWAHLAMHFWPERVVPKCAKDRSLAIAHGLEDVFWVEGNDGKWTARKTPIKSVDELVKERTSPAVKSALKSLLEAPVASGKSSGRKGGGRRKAGAAEGEDA